MSDWLGSFLESSFSAMAEAEDKQRKEREEERARYKKHEEEMEAQNKQWEKEYELYLKEKEQEEFFAALSAKAVGYKKRVSSSFVLVDGNKITEKLQGGNFSATKKIDGELRLVFITQRGNFSFNSAGRRDEELLCVKEFADICKKHGIVNAMFAAELTLKTEIAEQKRSRVSDVIHALATPALQESLALMPFDIVEFGGVPYEETDYAKTHQKLCELFNGASSLVCPVPMWSAQNVFEVQKIFDDVVTNGGAEGLVVHGPQTVVYKIKPRHSIDAIAIGYTTSDLEKNGQKLKGVRDILFAVRNSSGNYQVFASGSNGLKDKERIELRERFEKIVSQSAFIYSDSQSVAFRMIEPRYVFEVSVVDLISEISDCSAITNPLISFLSGFGYVCKGEVAGVSAYSLCVVRERSDKTASVEECGVHQLSDICPFSKNFHRDPIVGLPRSQIVERYVYKKEIGKKVLVKKFIILKTNKSTLNQNFSEYVFQYTDFSTKREEMLKKDVFASNSFEQVKERFDKAMEKEIKKGWIYIENPTG